MDFAEGRVRAFLPYVTEEGAVLDPKDGKEHEYATASFVKAGAVLLHSGRCPELQDTILKAMDWGVIVLAKTRFQTIMRISHPICWFWHMNCYLASQIHPVLNVGDAIYSGSSQSLPIRKPSGTSRYPANTQLGNVCNARGDDEVSHRSNRYNQLY